MAAIWQRINTLMLVLVLLALAGILGVLAARTEGGPLDPSDPPAPTDSVRLPGTPISEQTVIASSGKYYLTRNLDIQTDTTAIQITSNDVELDLNGFTISGIDGANGHGVHVTTGVERVRIRNGSIRDVRFGVEAFDAIRVTVDDVHVTGSAGGIRLGTHGVATGCSTVDNQLGIGIYGSHAIVRGCQVSSNFQDGIYIHENPEGVLIERSTLNQNNLMDDQSFAGIDVQGDLVTVRDSTMRQNKQADVRVRPAAAGTAIIDNVLTGCASIVIDQGALFTYAPTNSTDPHTNIATMPC